MKLNRVMLIVFLVGLMLVVAACSSDTQTSNGNDSAAGNNTTGNNAANDNSGTTEDTGGEDVEAIAISGGLVLDPALIALDDVSSQIVADYVFDGLVVLNEDGSIGAGLALTAEDAGDGLTYVFTLRTDAVFSDGTQVTADVIMANFNRWFDEENPLHGDGEYAAWIEYFKGFLGEMDADDNPVSLFDGIEKSDDLTVLIHLNEPMDNFLEIIALPFFGIVNPAGIEAGEYLGTGAYVIESMDSAGLVLAPSSSFWGDVPTENLVFTFE